MRSPRPTVDLTAQLTRVVEDLCARLPEFAHIHPRRLLMCVARARGSSAAGVFAKIVPMRFPDGSPMKHAHGGCYALPQIPTPDGDILYIIYVYVPRFFAQPFARRLLTLVHELYHIAPAFDGTLRKIGQRAHGASRAQFNDNLQPLLDQYLATHPAADVLAILHEELPALSRRATLVGRSLPLPKAVRIT